MRNLMYKSIFLMLTIFVFSCDSDSDDDGNSLITAPETYEFTRNGASSVSFSGQTTRLNQADELYGALNAETDETSLMLMFAGSDGTSAGFSNPDLNGTSKLIRSKTAASTLAGSATTKARFDAMITDFASNVVPNFNGDAMQGVAGAMTTIDGGSTYQFNAMGQEIDQTFFKGLIGAFTLDQIVNNYIHPNQLDSGTRIDDNDNDVLSGDNNYTDMEHKWDEGFGYLYGQEPDISVSGTSPGAVNGNLLMKYFEKVNDNYEPGIAQVVYDAFIMGRTAIVNKDYTLRDQQADIIQVELSKVIGYYSIHYLNDYLNKMQTGNIAGAFHALSEAHGFILSLQFTNNGNDEPFMDKATVEYFLDNYFANFYAVIGMEASFGLISAGYNSANPSQSGMIAQIDAAFEANGVTLNID